MNLAQVPALTACFRRDLLCRHRRADSSFGRVLNPYELPIRIPTVEIKSCCGCLIAVEHGDVADLICNERDVVVFNSAPIAEVE